MIADEPIYSITSKITTTVWLFLHARALHPATSRLAQNAISGEMGY